MTHEKNELKRQGREIRKREKKYKHLKRGITERDRNKDDYKSEK